MENLSERRKTKLPTRKDRPPEILVLNPPGPACFNCLNDPGNGHRGSTACARHDHHPHADPGAGKKRNANFGRTPKLPFRLDGGYLELLPPFGCLPRLCFADRAHRAQRRNNGDRKGGQHQHSYEAERSRPSPDDWSPLNQVRRKLQGTLGGSKLAVRVVADAVQKSSSQVLKLLEEYRGSHLGEVLRLADLAGYTVIALPHHFSTAIGSITTGAIVTSFARRRPNSVRILSSSGNMVVTLRKRMTKSHHGSNFFQPAA